MSRPYITYTILGHCNECGDTTFDVSDREDISALSIEDWVYDHKCTDEVMKERRSYE